MAASPIFRIGLIVAAGVFGASQVGKGATAIPVLRDSFTLSLIGAAWIVSAFSVIGTFAAIPVGTVIGRLAMRRGVVCALLLVACGNILGAVAQDSGLLILGRAVEGVGFIGIVIAAPTLLRQVAETDRQRGVAFAMWAAHVPAGIALALVAGPVIMRNGWQALWWTSAAVAVLLAALVAIASTPASPSASARQEPLRSMLADLFASTTARVMAGGFILYSIQFYSLTAFLPVLLVDRIGLSLAAAGQFSALAVAANAFGNVTAGLLIAYGRLPLSMAMTAAFVAIGLVGFGIFTNGPLWLVIGSAACGYVVTALLPASVIAQAPQLARSQPRLALIMALIQQAAATGQLIGPLILAFVVETFGWPSVAWLFAAIAAAGLTLVAHARRHSMAGQGRGRQVDAD